MASDSHFLKKGLPFVAFMVLSSVGLSRLIAPKMSESDRRKRFVEPEKPEDVLKKMQADLARTEFKIVPVPGQGQKDLSSMGRDQLLAELRNLRESEEWTGLKMDKQKLAVKQLLKRMPKT